MSYEYTTTSISVENDSIPAFYITDSGTALTYSSITAILERASEAVRTSESAAHSHGTLSSGGVFTNAHDTSKITGDWYIVEASGTNVGATIGRKIIVSSSAPSGNAYAAGDIWIQYTT